MSDRRKDQLDAPRGLMFATIASWLIWCLVFAVIYFGLHV